MLSTNKQTDRQTNATKNINSFVKGGNYAIVFQVQARQQLQQKFESHVGTHNIIRFLQLDQKGRIGYTLKCIGAGFWALRQTSDR